MVLTLIPTLSCEVAPEPQCPVTAQAVPAGTAQQSLSAVRGFLWLPGEQIPVCWWNLNGSEDHIRKAAIVRAAAEEWTADANIEFVGWGPCEAEGAGIAIAVADILPNSVIGTQALSKRPSMVLNFALNKWGGLSCSKRVTTCIRHEALHEFGHSLGFTHEANRDDSECGQVAGTTPDYNLTTYDADSVMNYCVGFKDVLSCGDLAGVQAVYGPK